MLFGMSEYNPTKISMDPGVRLHQDKVRQPVDTTECKKVIGCLRYLLHTIPDLISHSLLGLIAGSWKGLLLCIQKL